MDKNILLKGAGIIMDQNDKLREERDDTRVWILEVANLLQVNTNKFRSKDIAGQWKELRKRILRSLKEKNSA
jgi:hypothetical protein